MDSRPNPDPLANISLKTRTFFSWLLALVAGGVGTWMFHIPQFASRFDAFPGDRGDARLVAYLLEHWYQVIKGNNSWLSPPMFYPIKGVLGYADLLIGYVIPYSILRTLGLGIFQASEFTIIVLNFVNYFVCFVLLKKILHLNLLASCAGAMFFAFNSPKLVQLGHLQLQPLFFLPLAVIFVVLFVQRAATLGQKKAFALLSLAALSLDFQLLTGFYLGWFFIFWCFLFLLMIFLFRVTRSFVLPLLKKFGPAFIGAVTVLAFGMVPFLIVYVPVFRSSGGKSYEEVHELIPRLWSLMVMGERNYVWGTLSAAVQRLYPMHPELQIGIGLVPSLAWLAMTVFGIWLVIKNRKVLSGSTGNPEGSETQVQLKQMFLALVILTTTLFYFLGMRYWHDYSPWVLVYSSFPGAKGIRAVARYVILLAFPMAISFAFIIHYAVERISSRKSRALRISLATTLFVIVAFGLCEQFARKDNFNGFPIKAETAYLKTLAAALPDDCATFYVAVGPAGSRNQFEYQIDAILVSIIRDVPTLNGYSGQLPPNWFLWEVKAPEYEANVKKWIDEKHLGGNVCRLVIDESTTGTSSY